MPKTILSSRELNQDVGRAKKAAKSGPVIITDRGRPAFVLTTFEAHRKTNNKKRLSVFDALSMPEDNIELEFPRDAFYPRTVDFD